ncbi:hypothetical protein HY212_02145 [Candidatus Pacearchaeota archaeon]|nr:hypothetical protein [Candidatus Pacearchaeota archaeon]
MEKKNAVFYLGGGAMAGVFGGGVLKKLSDNKFHNRIERLYAGSAGGFNIAYFTAAHISPEQIEIGASIYYENLYEGFIFTDRILSAIRDRFARRFGFKKRGRDHINVLNVDHLINVARNVKVLDINALRQSSMPTYVKVFDTEKNEIVYLNLKENPLGVLRNAISVIPYYSPPKDQRFIDGGVIEQIGYDELKQRHPKSPIVFCINYHPEQFNNLKTSLRNTLEGIVASWMYPNKGMIGRFSRKVRDFQNDVDKIRNDSNALLIHPPKENPTNQRTIDPEKLLVTYKMGQEAAEKILEWVG